MLNPEATEVFNTKHFKFILKFMQVQVIIYSGIHIYIYIIKVYFKKVQRGATQSIQVVYRIPLIHR
jgi:hypothetical protein